MGTLPAIVKAIALNNKLDGVAGVRDASCRPRWCGGCARSQPASAILGVKQAPFVVLIGAQMPSVLTEIAFLTNRAEAGLLKQPGYRQHIAQALRTPSSVQDSLKNVTTVARAQAAGRSGKLEIVQQAQPQQPDAVHRHGHQGAGAGDDGGRRDRRLAGHRRVAAVAGAGAGRGGWRVLVVWNRCRPPSRRHLPPVSPSFTDAGRPPSYPSSISVRTATPVAPLG